VIESPQLLAERMLPAGVKPTDFDRLLGERLRHKGW
jgi:hypothetical protein